MNWLDLYTFLHEKANNIHSVGTFNWNKPVLVHDADTGDEFICDTYTISDSRGSDRLVLAINMEAIFGENSNGS
jgi:hypothetical protein